MDHTVKDTSHIKSVATPLTLGAVFTALGALFIALAGAVMMPTGASAQYYYSSPYGYTGPRYRSNNYYQRRKRRARRARSSRRKTRRKRSYAKTLREPVSDVMVLVSLKKQRIYIHDKKGLVAESPISSGRRGMDTPKGIFTILQKNKRHFSNLYANAPMPNMQRITWSGVAMHGGPLPGYPASHGCIRLPYSFAKTLFGITNMHGRVIVSDNPVAPKPISHSKLFQPLPKETSTLTRASAAKTNVTVAEAKPESRIDSDLGSVIGVGRDPGTQVAALVDPERLDRAKEIRRERTEKKAAIDKELGDAKVAYDLFQIDAKRTAKQLADARQALKLGKKDLAQRKANAKKASFAAAQAHKKLKDFDRKYRKSSRRMTSDRLQKLAEMEEALDANVLKFEDAANAAQKDARRAEWRIAGLEANIALAAKTHKTAVNKLAPQKKRLASARAALARYKEEEKQRAKPISVFISGKTGRLYARQGWYPVLDIPVKIENPRVALGTHLFTAIDNKDGTQDVEWNVVTVEDGRDGSRSNKRTRYRKRYGKKPGLRALRSAPSPAKLALERIDIPQHTRDRIEDLMKPGSSLIISDYPKSIETGQHTDFIVLTQ